MVTPITDPFFRVILVQFRCRDISAKEILDNRSHESRVFFYCSNLPLRQRRQLRLLSKEIDDRV